MSSFNSIVQMMQASAAEAVQAAGERFGFALDFTEESVASLETILANVCSTLKAEDQEAIEHEVKLWGSYLGEVVLRRWGGDWDLQQYPGGAVAVPSIAIGGSQVYPLIKVYRRLTLGEQESISNFYGKIREKLAAAHPTD